MRYIQKQAFDPNPVKQKRSQEKLSLGCKWGEQMLSLADKHLKAAIKKYVQITKGNHVK